MNTTTSHRIKRAIAAAAEAGAHSVNIDLQADRALMSDDRPPGQPGTQTFNALEGEEWHDVGSQMMSHVAPEGCSVTIHDNRWKGDHLAIELPTTDGPCLQQMESPDGLFDCRLVEGRYLYPVTVVMEDGVTVSAPRPTIGHPRALIITDHRPGSDVEEHDYALIAIAHRAGENLPTSSINELETILQLLFVRHLADDNGDGDGVVRHADRLTLRALREKAQWAGPANWAADQIRKALEAMPPEPMLCSVPMKERPYSHYITAPEGATVVNGRDPRRNEISWLAAHRPDFPIRLVRAASGNFPVATVKGATVAFTDGEVRHFDSTSPVPMDGRDRRGGRDHFELVSNIRLNLEVSGGADGRTNALTAQSPVWSASDESGHLLLYTDDAVVGDRATVRALTGEWRRTDLDHGQQMNEHAMDDPDDLYDDYAVDRVMVGREQATINLLSRMAAVVDTYRLDEPPEGQTIEGTSPSGRVRVLLEKSERPEQEE